MKLEWDWVEQRLGGTWNYWLCTYSAERGPHARPVWAVWAGGELVFTTSPTSRKARDIAGEPRVSVSLELAREVVVVEGVAREAAPAAAAVEAYAAKYAWTPPGAQRWYAVKPVRVYAADEATYPASATTFNL